jgi:hypothetical protein
VGTLLLRAGALFADGMSKLEIVCCGSALFHFCLCKRALQVPRRSIYKVRALFVG